MADWGSWADNVLSWLYMRETTPSFLLLRYEDMKKNTVEELQTRCEFSGTGVCNEREC